MAKNRHSNSCGSITSFDVYLKENYFPSNSNGGVCNIRGTIMDVASNNDAFSADKVEEITKKLDRKEALSLEDEEFIRTYVKEAKALLKENAFQEALSEKLAKAGVKRNAISTMYSIYKEKFPAEYRGEILSQVVAAVIRLLDELEAEPELEHLSRAEIIEEIGVANLMEEVRDTIKRCFDSIASPSAEQQKIADILFKDASALEAVFYMAKNKLFEAEKIKVGLDVESAEEEDEGAEEETEEIVDAEEQSPEHWMLKTDTISSFNSMSKENRSILYKLTTNTPGILGLPNIVDTLLIHQQLLELRHESACTNSTDFLNALANLDVAKCPWASQLYDILKNDPYRRTSFFNTYRRNHLNYNSLNKEYSKGNAVYYENGNTKDRNIPYQVYVAQIYNIEDPDKSIFTADGKINRARVNDYASLLTKPQTFRGVEIPPVYVKPAWGEGVFAIQNWAPEIGADPLHPTEEEIKEKKRDFINTMNAVLNLHMDEVEKDNLMEEGKFKTFLTSTVTLIASDIIKKKEATTVASLTDNRVIAAHMKVMTSVAKAHISLAERKSPVEKSYRFNGSTYMTYTICNHIGDFLERLSKAAQDAIASDNIEVFREYLENTFLKCRIFATKTASGYNIHNIWLKRLYESSIDDLKSDNSFLRKFTQNLERAVGMNEKEFENFTENEDYILCLNSYLNTRKNTDGNFGRYPLFVTGDSNSTRFLTAPILSIDEVEDAFVEVAKQEMERMQMFKDFIEWCDKNNYSVPKSWRTNMYSFTMFPFLNKDAATKKDLIDTYNKDINAFEAKVKSLIITQLNSNFKSWLDTLRQEGDNSLVNGISPTLRKEMLSIPGWENLDSNRDILMEYYYNYKLAMMQQFQLLTVDPGFYDHTIDLQKRYKEMIAAGTPLDLEALDPSDPTKKIDDNDGVQDVVYIQEQFYPGDEEAIKALEEAVDSKGNPLFSTSHIKKCKNRNKATDGQAWRSFKSYRKICIMLGDWTPEMERVWEIIQGARKRAKENGTRSRLNEEELEEIFNLGVVFQPIKPYYYGIEKIETDKGDGEIHIPVQHKCSEFPVIPELLPEDSPLTALGEAMEDESYPIDLAICTSAVKVGAFGATDFSKMSPEELKNKDSLLAAIKLGYKHKLSLSNWRKQSNVPEHADCSRALGTQLRLHWLSNIAGTVLKQYPFLKEMFPKGKIKLTRNSEPIDISKGLNEGTLLELYNSLASIGFIKSCLKAVKDLSNPNKMSDLLSNLKASDTREADDGIDAYTTNEHGEMKLSPNEGTSSWDNIASLMSWIRKTIIKQGMRGGSLVQVSTFGFQDVLKVHTEKTPDGKTNITYADCVKCFDLSVKDDSGKIVKLKYKDYVDYATGNLLKADGTAFTDAEIEDLEQKGVDWRAMTKLERDYPGILSLIAYRIPTEGHCSTLNLKVRKFLPMTAGAVVIVPALYTTIAGFDFDIDKLYYIRPEYNYKKLTEKENRRRIVKIWNAIYGKPNKKGPSKGTSAIYKALVKAREELRAQKAAQGGSGEVVAQSSDEVPNTIGSIVDADALYTALGLTPVKDTEESEEETEEEGLEKEVSSQEDDTESSEQIEEEIKEYEKLFQYWELAGLDKPISEGGTGMSAEEYFEKYYTEHYREFNTIETYDHKKSLYEQLQVVINNFLFKLYQARLEDYDTFQERYTPSGYENLLRARPIMLAIRYADRKKLAACTSFEKLCELAKEFEDTTPEYDPTDIATLIHFQVQNALYDQLIGIAANQNINQKYTSLMEKLRLKTPVKWGSMLKSNDPGMGRDIKQRFMEGIDPQSRRERTLDTEKSSKENLGSSVDSVKDAALEYFGVTVKNFNLASFMGKIGATPEDMGMILNQPIVMKAMKILENSTGFMDLSEALYQALKEMFGKDIAEQLIVDTLPNMHPSENEAKAKELSRDKYLSLDALTISIAKYAGNPKTAKDDADFQNTQVAVISILKELQVGATIVSDEINITKTTSVNSVQSDFGSIEATEQRAKSFDLQMSEEDFPFELEVTTLVPELRQIIIAYEERLTSSNVDDFMNKYMKSAFGIAQAAYSSVMTFVDAVIAKYFPFRSAGYQRFKNALSTLTKKEKLTKDIINTANKFLNTYFLERMVPMFREDYTPSVVTLDGTSRNTGIPNKYFYKKYFPTLFNYIMEVNRGLIQAGRKDVVDYHSIPMLALITHRKQGLRKGYKASTDVLASDVIGSLKKEQKNLYIESWEQMFKSEDPILRDLAVHLFMYSYFMGGFDWGFNTFMRLAPLALKESLGVIDGVPDSGYSKYFNRLFNLSPSENQSYLIEVGSLSDTAISIKKAIKTFLANNCVAFRQFSKIIYSKTKDDLYKALEPSLKEDDSKFTVDFTDKDDPNTLAIRSLIIDTKNEEIGDKKVQTFKVKPCIVIMEDTPAIYICDTNWEDENELDFNVCGGTITYYKIAAPMGKDNSDVKKVAEVDSKDYLENVKSLTSVLWAQYHEAIAQEKTAETEDAANTNENVLRKEFKKLTQELRSWLSKIANNSLEVEDIMAYQLLMAQIKEVIDKIENTPYILMDSNLKIIEDIIFKNKLLQDTTSKFNTNTQSSNYITSIQKLINNCRELVQYNTREESKKDVEDSKLLNAFSSQYRILINGIKARKDRIPNADALVQHLESIYQSVFDALNSILLGENKTDSLQAIVGVEKTIKEIAESEDLEEVPDKDKILKFIDVLQKKIDDIKENAPKETIQAMYAKADDPNENPGGAASISKVCP